MKKKNLFYLIFVLTIILVRLLVFLIPDVEITLGNFVVHHFWFGVLLLILGILVKRKIRFWFVAIGLGLALDQLVFILLGGGRDAQYWAWPSVVSVVVLAIFVFALRKRLGEFG